MRDVLTSSPSYLTGLAAAAEIKTAPSLTSQIDTGIQELITSVTTPSPTVTATGIPALDTVLTKLHTLSQTTSYTNVSHDLLAVVQRSDFPAFVKQLNPPDLVGFIPFATRMGLQLPIDVPDDDVIGAIIATIMIALLMKIDPKTIAWIALAALATIAALAYATRGHAATLFDLNGNWAGAFTYANTAGAFSGLTVPAQWTFSQNPDKSITASSYFSAPSDQVTGAFGSYTGSRTGNTVTLIPTTDPVNGNINIFWTLSLTQTSLSGSGIYGPYSDSSLTNQPAGSTALHR